MQLPVVNHPDYVAKINDDNKFPIKKFGALASHLIENKVVKEFYIPKECSIETMKTSHSIEYINQIKNRLVEILPNGPKYFPEDQISDKPERFFVNEIIREKILLYFSKEIPYSVEVTTDSFKDDENILKISSIIMVERESQKGIIIGHKGNALRKVGTKARIDLEKFFEKKIFLDLKVRLNKNWRSNDLELKKFGYNQK